MKKCFKCEEVKPLHDFYKHKQMADGHLNKCKECNKLEVRENRKKNISHYKEYEKSRAMLPHRVKLREEYAKTHEGKLSILNSKKKYAEKNPIKRAAHIITGNAIRDGKLIKGLCEICGGEKVHAHHDDYYYPMSVRWLCPKHHQQWHRENGKGLNSD